jgi:hypothetical protein
VCLRRPLSKQTAAVGFGERRLLVWPKAPTAAKERFNLFVHLQQDALLKVLPLNLRPPVRFGFLNPNDFNNLLARVAAEKVDRIAREFVAQESLELELTVGMLGGPMQREDNADALCTLLQKTPPSIDKGSGMIRRS